MAFDILTGHCQNDFFLISLSYIQNLIKKKKRIRTSAIKKKLQNISIQHLIAFKIVPLLKPHTLSSGVSSDESIPETFCLG